MGLFYNFVFFFISRLMKFKIVYFKYFTLMDNGADPDLKPILSKYCLGGDIFW